MKIPRWFVIGMVAGGGCASTQAIENEPSPALLARVDVETISDAGMVQVRGEALPTQLSNAWKKGTQALKAAYLQFAQVAADPSVWTTEVRVPPSLKPDEVAFSVHVGSRQGSVGEDGFSGTFSVGPFTISRGGDGTVAVCAGASVGGGAVFYMSGSWAVCKNSKGELYQQWSLDPGLGFGPKNWDAAATVQATWTRPLSDSNANALVKVLMELVDKVPAGVLKDAAHGRIDTLIKYLKDAPEDAQVDQARGTGRTNNKNLLTRSKDSPATKAVRVANVEVMQFLKVPVITIANIPQFFPGGVRAAGSVTVNSVALNTVPSSAPNYGIQNNLTLNPGTVSLVQNPGGVVNLVNNGVTFSINAGQQVVQGSAIVAHPTPPTSQNTLILGAAGGSSVVFNPYPNGGGSQIINVRTLPSNLPLPYPRNIVIGGWGNPLYRTR